MKRSGRNRLAPASDELKIITCNNRYSTGTHAGNNLLLGGVLVEKLKKYASSAACSPAAKKLLGTNCVSVNYFQ